MIIIILFLLLFFMIIIIVITIHVWRGMDEDMNYSCFLEAARTNVS